MANQKTVQELVPMGMRLWDEGLLTAAAETFREALTVADPESLHTNKIRGMLAGVLSELDQDDDSLAQYIEVLKQTLDFEVLRGPAAVAMAHYFVAEQLLKMRREEEALTFLDQALVKSREKEGLLRTVQADCLWCLNRTDQALESADLALAAAMNEEERVRISDRLSDLLALKTA